jgi:threonine synthase
MRLILPSQPRHSVRFQDALFQSAGSGGELYMPAQLPSISVETLDPYAQQSFNALAGYLTYRLLTPEVDTDAARSLVDRAFAFAPALRRLDSCLYVLELFTGPTFSFKDFGANFLAQCLQLLNPRGNRPITILVATSGDTGSAVANAFFDLEGFRVVLLYPKDKISPMQEAQITTYGNNIIAAQVEGNFDDCQRLVKTALADPALGERMVLTSANSINIGRLLPQMFYYLWGRTVLRETDPRPPVWTVPCGNFGNLTAALLAHRMGMPAHRFVTALNRNRVVADYLQRGEWQERPAVATVSNAMDVARPSNWARIETLYKGSLSALKKDLWACSVNDVQTLESIRTVYQRYHYITDPHTAVAFAALDRFKHSEAEAKDLPAIIVATAHSAKFPDTVSRALGIQTNMPEPLLRILSLPKQITPLSNRYSAFKALLISGS